jgi:hypothetical protein
MREALQHLKRDIFEHIIHLLVDALDGKMMSQPVVVPDVLAVNVHVSAVSALVISKGDREAAEIIGIMANGESSECV